MDDSDQVYDDEMAILNNNATTTSSISINYKPHAISLFLKNNPKEWLIQEKKKNINVKYSDVWNVFGEPSKINESGVYIIIEGFASCLKCYKTYIKKKDTGTNPLRNHSCFKKYMLEKKQHEQLKNMTSQATTSLITSSSSSTCNFKFNPLSKYGLVIKSTKLTSDEKNKIKEATVQWLCQSMRPFSIVNDIGLRNVIQHTISLGAKYGNIDVNSILPGRAAVTEHSKIMTNIHRENLKSNFAELQMSKSLTIIPDLWSDKFNTSSYLGITCNTVDSDFSHSSFDLAMYKYTEIDKKAENIASAMDKALLPFDINLSNTNVMCDRGSNFVKCFKYYDPLHCYAHRLNNVIKKCFFQNQKKRTTDASASNYITPATTVAVNDILNSSNDEDSCDEADDEYVPSIKLKSKRKSNINTSRTRKTNSSMLAVDHMKLNVSELPIEAREYLIKLKEAGLNDEIKSMASVSLKQSTSVRWLSLINSLQSLHRAYKATKK
ncbi:unnamed protein product, partial [Rotaria sordida]